MTKTAFERDGILTPQERVKSAKKCLSLIHGEDVRPRHLWRGTDVEFFDRQVLLANGDLYCPSERELAWLRDLISRYVT